MGMRLKGIVIGMFVLFLGCHSAYGQMDSLPAQAKEYIEKKYKKYTLREVDWNEAKQVYDVELQKKKKVVRLKLSKTGELLSVDKFKEFDYDGTKEEYGEPRELDAPPPMPRL